MKKFLLSISSFALSFGVLNASHSDLHENAEGVALGASVPNHNPLSLETEISSGLVSMTTTLSEDSHEDPLAVGSLTHADNDQTSEKDETQDASEEAVVIEKKHRKHIMNEAGEEVSASADEASPNKKSTEEFPVNAEESSVESPKGATAPPVEAIDEEPKVEEKAQPQVEVSAAEEDGMGAPSQTELHDSQDDAPTA